MRGDLLDDSGIHLLYSPRIDLQFTPYILSYALYFLNLIRRWEGTMSFLEFPHCCQSAHIQHQDQRVNQGYQRKMNHTTADIYHGPHDEGRDKERVQEKENRRDIPKIPILTQGFASFCAILVNPLYGFPSPPEEPRSRSKAEPKEGYDKTCF